MTALTTRPRAIGQVRCSVMAFRGRSPQDAGYEAEPGNLRARTFRTGLSQPVFLFGLILEESADARVMVGPKL